MRRLCGETQLPDRLLGKDPSSCFAQPPVSVPSAPVPVTQRHPLPRSQSLPKGRGDGHALSPTASWSQPPQAVPRLGMDRPSGVSQGLTVEGAPGDLSPHRGQRGTRPPPSGRLASSPSCPGGQLPSPCPLSSSSVASGSRHGRLSPPLLRPPTHTAHCPQDGPHTHARPSGPAQSRLPAPTHSRSLPPPPRTGTGDGICHVYLHKEEETRGFLK